MTTSAPGTPSPRLMADFFLRRGDFRLHVQLAVGAEVLVLFGPSGSGKTTTLNAIAGLIAPERGQITLDGQVLFRRDGGRAINLPARRRRIGYVFQHYALFPHLTALQNVAFALHGPAGRARAQELLERMNLAHLADRYPHELSGGQQQRVAIARALAARPEVLLLDEPFSALDAGARQHLQLELASWQQELGLAVIYVTHRLEDAFALGQRLAVMRDGRVEQIGPIEQVFRYPASAQVAEVMGIPNIFRPRVVAARADGLVLDWDGLELIAGPQDIAAGSVVTAYVRPEDVKVLYPDRPLVDAIRYNQATGRIVASRPAPGGRVLRVRLSNGREIEVHHGPYTYTRLNLQVGDVVQLSLRREALVIFGRP
ncbi:MAG: ABC transporter ATP-binding protein [Anaerolineae bacterium]